MPVCLVSAMVEPMTSGIELGLDGNGIASLIVNRPGSRNALSWAAQEAFANAVEAVAADEAARVLIVTGAGGQFVSGGDLKQLAGHPEPQAGERLNRVMSAALDALARLPIPVIAAVDGDAVGGGCEVITACDLRVASAAARFAFRQVQNGLTSGWGGTARLVRLIGQSRAMDLLLSGRSFGAAEAQAMGLVHRIAPQGAGALDAARQWASELSVLPRGALAATKALVLAAAYQSPGEISVTEREAFVGLWPTADHLEAMRAFVEKRPPLFNQEN